MGFVLMLLSPKNSLPPTLALPAQIGSRPSGDEALTKLHAVAGSTASFALAIPDLIAATVALWSGPCKDAARFSITSATALLIFSAWTTAVDGRLGILTYVLTVSFGARDGVDAGGRAGFLARMPEPYVSPDVSHAAIALTTSAPVLPPSNVSAGRRIAVATIKPTSRHTARRKTDAMSCNLALIFAMSILRRNNFVQWNAAAADADVNTPQCSTTMLCYCKWMLLNIPAFLLDQLSRLTDQPGRWMAVCVFSPWLMWRGWVHSDVGIAAFSALLFSWDLYWLVTMPPKRRLLVQPRETAPRAAAIEMRWMWWGVNDLWWCHQPAKDRTI